MKASNRFKYITLSIVLTLVAPNVSLGQLHCSLVFLNQQKTQAHFNNLKLIDLQKGDEIPLKEFKEMKKLPPEGLNNDGIFSANFMGKKVFLKSIQVDSKFEMELFLNEMAWTKLLSEIKMGPQFYGIARDSKSRLHFIVTEFIDSKKFATYQTKSFSQENINRFRAGVLQLVSIGIFPKDMQFYFTPNGEVRFFDPGFYEWHDR